MKKLLYTNHPETRKQYDKDSGNAYKLAMQIAIATWAIGLALALIAWLS